MTTNNDYYNENDHSLLSPKIVMRDSLGALAIEILKTRHDISTMEQKTMLVELTSIISELHQTYDDNLANLD